MSTTKPREPRDKRTGRYVDAKLDKVCRCGHTLGEHTAERVAGEQPCLFDHCECESFTPASGV